MFGASSGLEPLQQPKNTIQSARPGSREPQRGRAHISIYPIGRLGQGLGANVEQFVTDLGGPALPSNRARHHETGVDTPPGASAPLPLEPQSGA